MTTTPRDHTSPVLDEHGWVISVPIPSSKATELYPGLWLGSCCRGAGGDLDRNALTYGHVLTLCGPGEEEPLHRRATCSHRRYRMDDGPIVPPAKDLARLVTWTVTRINMGEPVLLRCWAGLNRSGLVAVLALAELTGMDGQTALNAARRTRSPHVLCNPAFAAHVARVPAHVPGQRRG